MSTLTRHLFAAQQRRARIVSEFEHAVLEVCLVRYRDGVTNVSIVGGAVSTAIYWQWRMQGTRWRVLARWHRGKQL